MPQHGHPGALGDLRRAVGRAVVDHDDVELRRVSLDRLDHASQRL
jgi:hypothetical protein